jgi:hypothetical protein
MQHLSDADVRARVDCATCIKLQHDVFLAKALGQVMRLAPYFLRF